MSIDLLLLKTPKSPESSMTKKAWHLSVTSEQPAGTITQAGNRNSASGPKGDSSFQTGSDMESTPGCQRLLVWSSRGLKERWCLLCRQKVLGRLHWQLVLCRMPSPVERQNQTERANFSPNHNTQWASQGAVIKNPPANGEDAVWSLGREDSLEEQMATHSVFLPGESHGQRSLAG